MAERFCVTENRLIRSTSVKSCIKLGHKIDWDLKVYYKMLAEKGRIIPRSF